MSGILVVCTGNICRSPMAEGFLRAALVERLGDAAPVVTSAGTAGWDGSGAMEESIRAAQEHGVDIGTHLARRLDPAMVEDADLVVCMAADHREAIVARCRAWTPARRSRSRSWSGCWRRRRRGSARRSRRGRRGRDGTGRRGRAEDVRDPLGEPIDGYREVAEELHDLSGRLADAPSPGIRADADRARRGSRRLRAEGGAQGLPRRRRATSIDDHGTDSTEPVDYPPFCAAAARAVADRGGRPRDRRSAGPARASRSPRTRWTASGPPSATTCSWPGSPGSTTMPTSWRWGRAWSRPRTLGRSCASGCDTPFDGGRHVPRLEQIAQIERGEL